MTRRARAGAALAPVVLVALTVGGCGSKPDYCESVSVVMDAGAQGTGGAKERGEVLDALDVLVDESTGQEQKDWQAFADIVKQSAKGPVSEADLRRLDPAMDRLQTVVSKRCAVRVGTSTTSTVTG